MPANLTPEYEKAELRYRQAASDEERVAALQEMLAANLRELPGGPLEVVSVSARTREGFERWFERLWRLLAKVRVYSKEPGKSTDWHKPFVLPAGSTVADLARMIHRDLPDKMKFARLWGHSRNEGQKVHKSDVLCDRDIVEIHE